MNTETTGSNGVKASYTTHVPVIPKEISKLPGQDLVPKMATTANFIQTIPIGGDSGNVTLGYGYLTTPAPLPLKLYAKIHKIIKDGIRIGKNGRNDFHKYDYVTEADVVDEIKRIFTENNLVYDFNIVGTRKVEGLENVTEVEAEITLIDLDSSESKVYSFFGQGQDKGDKGIYKAYTGLQKYFFMKNFLISTGDDPENDTGKANQAVAKPATTAAAPTKKSAFVAPTRAQAVNLTTIGIQKTVVTADPELLNKDILNGTISKDNLTKVADVVNNLPVSGSVTLPDGKTSGELTATTQGAPRQATAVSAAPTETAPVVKKRRQSTHLVVPQKLKFVRNNAFN